jgi:surface protein
MTEISIDVITPNGSIQTSGDSGWGKYDSVQDFRDFLAFPVDKSDPPNSISIIKLRFSRLILSNTEPGDTILNSLFVNINDTVTEIEFGNTLSSYDLQHVINISYMFQACTNLVYVKNFDIFCNALEPSTGTSSLEHCRGIFQYCTNLLGDNADGGVITPLKWELVASDVANKERLFNGCESIETLDLTTLDFSTSVSMNAMFADCKSLVTLDLQQNINAPSLQLLTRLFNRCHKLNSGNIFEDYKNDKRLVLKFTTDGNMPDLTSMNQIIDECSLIKYVHVDISNTTALRLMSKFCRSCTSLKEIIFNQNLNTEKVEQMDRMFYNCPNLDNLDISNFDFSTISLQTTVGGGDTNNSVLMSTSGTHKEYILHKYLPQIFGGCFNLNRIIVSEQFFDFLQQRSNEVTYNGNTGINRPSDYDFNVKHIGLFGYLQNYGTTASTYDDGSHVQFYFSDGNVDKYYDNNTKIDDGPYECKLGGFSGYFNGDTQFYVGRNSELPTLLYTNNTKTQLTFEFFRPEVDMSNLFNTTTSGSNPIMLQEIDFDDVNTRKATNFNNLFQSLDSLTTLDLSSFDTSNVTDMGYMFYDCLNLTELDIQSFDTHNVTDMGYMFYDCLNLTELDIQSFDTHNVTNWVGFLGRFSSVPSSTYIVNVGRDFDLPQTNDDVINTGSNELFDNNEHSTNDASNITFTVPNQYVKNNLENHRELVNSINTSPKPYYYNVVYNSEAGADPYIKPMYGNLYKLPDIDAFYRLIQSPDVIINVQVQAVDQTYINTKLKRMTDLYFESVESHVYDWQSMHFFTKLCVIYNNEVCTYNLLNGVCEGDIPDWVSLSTEENATSALPIYQGEQATYTSTLHIANKIKLELAVYENPQVLNGIKIIKSDANVDGLLIKSYSSESALVDSLYDTCCCKFIPASGEHTVKEIFYRNDGTEKIREIIVA